eukprot:1454725-Rhodomonas_salina.2
MPRWSVTQAEAERPVIVGYLPRGFSQYLMTLALRLLLPVTGSGITTQAVAEKTRNPLRRGARGRRRDSEREARRVLAPTQGDWDLSVRLPVTRARVTACESEALRGSQRRRALSGGCGRRTRRRGPGGGRSEEQEGRRHAVWDWCGGREAPH